MYYFYTIRIIYVENIFIKTNFYDYQQKRTTAVKQVPAVVRLHFMNVRK